MPTDDQPTPPPVDVDSEGDDDDHDVPADLTVLHEVLEFEAAKTLGPNQ